MRIFPFCYVCPRDWRLFENLVGSWHRIEAYVPYWVAFADRREASEIEKLRGGNRDSVKLSTRPDHFHPWSGWPHAMSKLDGWRQMVADPSVKDSDYVLYCDSDTYFWNAEILGALEGYDFVGFAHDDYKFVPPLKRQWSWLSGCFQAARAGFVREVVNMDYREMEKARQELLDGNFSHNEDVVISYLFARMGAKEHRLSRQKYMEGEVEAAFRKEINPKSFSHFNHGPCKFLGVEIAGKWEIPMALEKAGINL